MSQAEVMDREPAATAAAGRSGSRRWWSLAVLSACVLVLNLDLTVLNVGLATISRELHAGTAELQWMVAAFQLTSAGLLLVAGVAGDRWGRKRVLLGGLAVFGVASLMGAWAPNTGVLIAARALMGAGAAVVPPLTLAIIPTMFSPDERGRAIGIWTAMISLGMPLGPIVGGLLLDHFWWGSIFLLNVVAVAALLPPALILLPESRSSDAGAVDLPGVALFTAGVAALIYGLIDAEQGWRSPATLGWIAAGIIVLAAFVARERIARRPLVDLALFRRAAFVWPVAATVMLPFSMMGLLFVVPLYLQGVLGRDALSTGIRLLPLAAMILIGSLLSDRLTRRLGARWAVGGALLLVAASYAVLSRLTPAGPDLLVVIGLAVFGLGAGIAQPPAMSLAVNALPRESVGSGAALLTAFRMVAAVFGTAVVGSVVSSLYVARVGPSLTGLAPGQADVVRSSIVNVTAIASRLGSGPGGALRAAAYDAFTGAMGTTLLACAAGAVVIAALFTLVLPRGRGGAREG